MSTWFRVFGADLAEADPAALLENLQGVVPELQARFHGDDKGWFRAELSLPGGLLELERFITSEEGIRAELNSWAAWIESNEDNPHCGRLMQHMIGTAQLFTLELPEGVEAEDLCFAACRFLAGATAGIYQVDERGFFAADGTLLLKGVR